MSKASELLPVGIAVVLLAMAVAAIEQTTTTNPDCQTDELLHAAKSSEETTGSSDSRPESKMNGTNSSAPAGSPTGTDSSVNTGLALAPGYQLDEIVNFVGHVEAHHGGHKMSFPFNLNVKIGQGAGNGYVSDYGVLTLNLNLLAGSKVRLEIKGFLKKPGAYRKFCHHVEQIEFAHLVKSLKFSQDGSPNFTLEGEIRRT